MTLAKKNSNFKLHICFHFPAFILSPSHHPTHPLWPNVSPIFIPTPITRHSCLSRIKAFDGLLQRLGPPPVPIAPLFSRTYLSISVAHLPWASMLTLVEMSPRPLCPFLTHWQSNLVSAVSLFNLQENPKHKAGEDKSSLIVALISFLKLLLLSIGDTHAPRSSLNTLGLVINDAIGCRSSTLRCYKMFESPCPRITELWRWWQTLLWLWLKITIIMTHRQGWEGQGYNCLSSQCSTF